MSTILRSKSARRRKLVIESFESRFMMAADPVLLKDLNNAPDPSIGSSQIEWADTRISTTSNQFFLAHVNSQVELWRTNGIEVDTSRIATYLPQDGEVHLFLSFDRVYIHQSNTNSTAVYSFDTSGGLIESAQFDFGTKWLGIGLGTNLLVMQRTDDNLVFTTVGASVNYQPMITLDGPATQVAKTETTLLLRSPSSQGVVESVIFLGNNAGVIRSEVASEELTYYSYQSQATFASDSTGLVSFVDSSFSVGRPISDEAVKPDSVAYVGGLLYTASYDVGSGITRIGRSLDDGKPSEQVAVLNGFATVYEIWDQVAVVVPNGVDKGVWREDQSTNTLVLDADLSKFELGNQKPFQNADFVSLLGWSDFAAVGTELATLTPTPFLSLSRRSFYENNYEIAYFNRNGVSANAVELVPGPGDEDNAFFTIDSQGYLLPQGTFDFERDPIKHVRVRTFAGGQAVEQAISFFVLDIAETVAISKDSIPENSPQGTVVGNLSPLGFTGGSAATYSVLAVDGSETDTRFGITDGKLVLQGTIDFESSVSHTVSVRALSSDGSVVDSDLLIYVENVNENAVSPITITSDRITENESGPEGQGLVVGTLGVRAQSGAFAYELVSGSGDYDNFLFTIEGESLVFNSIADRETQGIYSIRIRATDGTNIVEGNLDIDVNPVDEFDPDYIRFLDTNGFEMIFAQFDENTPIDTIGLTFETVDADKGENYVYEISGQLAQYFRVEGNQMIVSAPIDFETTGGSLDLYVRATNPVTGKQAERYQPGITGDSSLSVNSVRDINEAPIIANVANQSVAEGAELRTTLATPLAFDVDRDDQGYFPNFEFFANDGPLPSWLTIDWSTGEMIATPQFGDDGTYRIEIRATDPHGLVGVGTFILTVQPTVPINLSGTQGNDNIVFRLLGNVTNPIWNATVNGATVFNGPITQSTLFSIDSRAGNDTVSVLGGNGSNVFRVKDNLVSVGSVAFRTTSVETRNLRGQAGADTFLVQLPSTATRNPQASRLNLFGGTGADTLQVSGDSSTWNITDSGAGTVNGISFSSMRDLIGTDGNDEFRIERSGKIVGSLNGASGFDSLVYVNPNQEIEVSLSSFAILSGTSNGVPAFTNVEGVQAPPNPENVLRYEMGALASPTDLASWILSNTSVQLNGFVATGFTDLRGTSAPDEFYLPESVAPNRYRIEGGDSTTTNNYLTYGGNESIIVNLQSNSATGIAEFSDITQFYVIPSGTNSKVIGKNSPASWSVLDSFIAQSSGPSFINFQQLFGGNQEDNFQIVMQSAPAFPMAVDGGLGRNRIDYSQAPSGIEVNLTAGTASYLQSLARIADVIGSGFDDILIGNQANNKLFGMAGNDSLTGNDGDDVLFGGSGNDSLFGGNGRDWLLGGSGADMLVGGLGDDLLIGGLGNGFEDETNVSTLGFEWDKIDLIMNEWTSSRSYAQRIQRLLNGIGPRNSVKLSNATLSNDNAIDFVLGNEGDDWFWASSNDTLADRRTAERLSNV